MLEKGYTLHTSKNDSKDSNKVHIDLSKYIVKDANGKIVVSKSDAKNIACEISTQKSLIKVKVVEEKIGKDTILVVEYCELIDLNKFNLNSRRLIIKEFLLNEFKNKQIFTVDGLKIGTSNISAKKVSRITINNQQEIALYSENLIQIAKFDTKKKSYKNKEGDFRYYKSNIKMNFDIFEVTLNIFSDQNGSSLYDINKITKIQHHSSEGYGQNLVYTSNISNKDNNVNNSNKLEDSI